MSFSLARTNQAPYVRKMYALPSFQTILAKLGSIKTPIFWALFCAAFPAFSQPPPLFQLGPSQILPDHYSFAFGVSAPVGRTYVIDVSTNLFYWSSVATNISSSDYLPFSNTVPLSFERGFYRGRLYWTIIVQSTYPTWETLEGSDGRAVVFPSSWKTAQGADGRLVAFPSSWVTAEGRDGRLIAFPTNWTTVEGTDGRVIALPPSGFAAVHGVDGRSVACPPGWTNAEGMDARQVSYSPDWLTSQQGDGRLVVFPSYGFLTSQGSDARYVAYPALAWGQAEGTDGRNIAYSLPSFTAQGTDGRLVAYPRSDWTTIQGSDGRIVICPTNSNATVQVYFEDQSAMALLGALNALIPTDEFDDYIIYVYFGTGNQQFQ